MSAANAETARQIADIINFRPEEFSMLEWEPETPEALSREECGTTRCIAGWTGFLHNDYLYDSLSEKKAFTISDSGYFEALDKWKARQSERLGLKQAAGGILFLGSDKPKEKFSSLLHRIAKETENRAPEDLISKAELEALLVEENF